jgi:hypothetical protein
VVTFGFDVGAGCKVLVLTLEDCSVVDKDIEPDVLELVRGVCVVDDPWAEAEELELVAGTGIVVMCDKRGVIMTGFVGLTREALAEAVTSLAVVGCCL